MAAAAGVAMALALPALAKPGDLDTTFGADGIAWASFRACNCGGNASMRVQPDGKIVVLGTTHLARYLSDGTPDQSFGNGGVVPLNIGTAKADGLAVDRAGRAVVVAHATALSRTVLRRWTPSGAADTAFAVAADAIKLFRQPLVPVGVAEQIVGSTARYIIGSSSPTGAFVVLGIQETGRADVTFGIAGQGTNSGQGSYAPYIPFAWSMAIEPGNGRIIVAGQTRRKSGTRGSYPLVVRFTARGIPDPLFGAAGLAVPSFIYETDAPGIAVAVAPGGAVYVVGSFSYDRGDSGEDFIVWRLTPDGSDDESFGSYGSTVLNGPTRIEPALRPENQDSVGDFASAVTIQPDGKAIVSGSRFTTGFAPVGVRANFFRTETVRLLTNGALDLTFGASGWLVGLAGDGRALALQNGDVLIGGDLSNRGPAGTTYQDAPPPPNARLGFRVSRFAG
jgi:uncharacterized delta-60 repeat protein